MLSQHILSHRHEVFYYNLLSYEYLCSVDDIDTGFQRDKRTRAARFVVIYNMPCHICYRNVIACRGLYYGIALYAVYALGFCHIFFYTGRSDGRYGIIHIGNAVCGVVAIHCISDAGEAEEGEFIARYLVVDNL